MARLFSDRVVGLDRASVVAFKTHGSSGPGLNGTYLLESCGI